MHVVQVIDELRTSGGAERLQWSFAEAVQDLDIDLTVMTLHENDPRCVSELEALGVRVVCFPAARFLSLRRAFQFSRFLRNNHFDVAHVHLVRSTVLGCLAARAAGVPTVATIHNTRRRADMSSLLLAAEAWVLRHLTDRVVAVGWETARVHQPRIGGASIEIIPNAVGEPDPIGREERAAIRAGLGVPDDATLLISVGRLNPQKAFPDLLQAFGSVLAAHPDARLCIAGMGRERDELEREVASRGLSERVRFLGLRRDVPKLLAASDIYVSAAHWEGLPVATLEAMAAGLPVVATRVGDVPRVVAPGTGTLVEPGDPDALAAALVALLDDPALRRRQGEAARLHVQKHFGRDVWAADLIELYRALSSKHAGAEPAVSEEPRCVS
jgi:glycosyltransferase involved in cell wall biosynthesis